MREAPSGRVRYHLGNHEMAVLFPELFQWPGTYSVNLGTHSRRAFIGAVADGRIPAAFSGYRYTYSHAGSTETFDVGQVNDVARSAAAELLAALDQDRDTVETQRRIAQHHGTVYGLGGTFGRGVDAGLLWMDFKHMPADAPPQIVGHTRQKSLARTGQVICENVIRANLSTPGGECVVFESADGVEAVVRRPNGIDIVQP